jgi:hypothetical protein
MLKLSSAPVPLIVNEPVLIGPSKMGIPAVATSILTPFRTTVVVPPPVLVAIVGDPAAGTTVT